MTWRLGVGLGSQRIDTKEAIVVELAHSASQADPLIAHSAAVAE